MRVTKLTRRKIGSRLHHARTYPTRSPEKYFGSVLNKKIRPFDSVLDQGTFCRHHKRLGKLVGKSGVKEITTVASEINIQIGETGLEKKDKNKVIRTKWMRKILKMKKDETEEKLGMTDPR